LLRVLLRAPGTWHRFVSRRRRPRDISVKNAIANLSARLAFDVFAQGRVDLAYELSSAGTIVARFIALGLDQMATDEDNEPTALHMSEGGVTIDGLIGTKEFKKDRAALFFTQQHGENNLFEAFLRD
jgi:hypothetical protein